MSSELRVAFFGTPHLAVWVLEELKEVGLLPSVVVCPPDRPAGRKLVLTPPATRVWAEENGVPVVQAGTLRDPARVPEIANSEWDLFIVAAYNLIMPTWAIELPRHGVLNVHPSLLPALRGPSPIRSALLRDERDSVGTSVMLLDKEIDHGPIVAQARVELPEWPVPGNELDELLFREGGRLLAEVIPPWVAGEITPEEQDHEKATYTQKLVKADGELDLDADGYQNYCKYCAYQGWPGTFFFVERDGKQARVKVTDAQYKDGTFEILRVTPEGKKEMEYGAFLNAA